MPIATFLLVIGVSTLIGSIVPWHPLGVLAGTLIVLAMWIQDRLAYAHTSSTGIGADDSDGGNLNRYDDEDLEDTRDIHLETEEKEYRNCPVPSCGKRIVVNKDGTLRIHGPKGNRCPGLVVEVNDPDQLVMGVVTIPVIKGDPEADKIVDDLRRKKKSEIEKRPINTNTDKSEYTPSEFELFSPFEKEKDVQEKNEEIETVCATPEDVAKDLASTPLNDEERKELDALKDYMSIMSLGDRPASPPAARLQRLMELESRSVLSGNQN